MSYEWHPEFALGFSNRQDLKDVVEGHGRFAPVQDLYARLQLLAQSVEESKWNTDAKSLSQRERRPNLRGTVEIPYTYQRLTLRYHDRKERTVYTDFIRRQMNEYADLGFVTPALTEDDLARLPPLSFFIYVPFTLASPYLSKDDEPFYVHENPVRKEHVLRVPLMSSTSWKGAFRAALRYRLQADDDADPRLVRLLGSQKGVEKGFRRGRLAFFPTFFDALEVEVINPHSRETSAGSQPIHIEAVPPGAYGVFALLYVPAVAPPTAGRSDWSTVIDDVLIVLKTTYTLLVELGFGAKTSAGMGRAAMTIPQVSGGQGYLLLPIGEGRAPARLPVGSLKELVGISQYIEEQRGGPR